MSSQVGAKFPTIGVALTRLLAERGFSQRELAQMLDTSEKQVSRWILNQTAPYPKTRRAIAKALGVDPIDLLGEAQDAA